MKFRTVIVLEGINDALVSTQADVGNAIGTGADVAIDAGDIVIVRGGLSAVVRAVNLSRATFRWAFFYNLVTNPRRLQKTEIQPSFDRT